MMCWTRRTGANTWRSFPPLQMIIAIIIVIFYSIFFCCSIWTLIRVCVGHRFTIPLPSFLPPPSYTAHTGSLRPVDVSRSRPFLFFLFFFFPVGGWMVLRGGGGGFKQISWTSTEPVHPPPSLAIHPPLQYHILGFYLTPLALCCRGVVVVSPPTPPSALWYCWVVLLPVSVNHTVVAQEEEVTFTVRTEDVRAFYEILEAGFAERNTFLDILNCHRNFSDKVLDFVLKPLDI